MGLELTNNLISGENEMLIVNYKITEKNKLIRKNWEIVFGIFIFRIVLDFIYTKFISTIFGYTGFVYSNDFSRYILSWFVLFMFLPLIIKLNKKICFSSVIMILLAYLSIVPFTTMIAYYPFTINYIINNIIYWFAMFIIYIFFPKIKLVRIKYDSMVKFLNYFIVLLFCFAIIFISWKFTGFRISLNIFNVYDLRSEASEFKLPTILSYIYSASKAVNPILIVYYLSNKKYRPAIFIFIIQILSFSINGSKTVLFSTILSILLYWLYNEKYIVKLPYYLAFLSMVGVFEVYINKTFVIITFIIRRVLFVPNLLNYYYFDFFSLNTPDYLKQSFLRHFGTESIYPEIDNLIGFIYFNKPDMGANNGLMSDAYANFGFIGLLIMPIIVIFSLKILDACVEGLDIRIFIISAVTLAFIFISSFFFTILLTHGFIALCLISYILPRHKITSK